MFQRRVTFIFINENNFGKGIPLANWDFTTSLNRKIMVELDLPIASPASWKVFPICADVTDATDEIGKR